MKFFPVALLALSLSHSAAAQNGDDGKTCSANPECAALNLADDCCPTSLAGIFLDCCEDKGASCAVNPGCSGLVEDCCPNADGVFLYCCFEPDPSESGFKLDYHYAVTSSNSSEGSYWLSTGQVEVNDDSEVPNVSYKRNSDVLFDMIYFEGEVREAGKYITGERKWYLNIYEGTTAPECTQVILQLDNVPAAKGDNYPTGRHSRYLGTILPPDDQGLSRVEFDFLDRPDEGVADEDVNAVALFFDPGAFTEDIYKFSDLSSYVRCAGTGEGCVASPVKACAALYVEIAGEDINEAETAVLVEEGPVPGENRTRFLQSQPDCSDCRNPACMGVGECSVAQSFDSLEEDQNFEGISLTQDGSTEEGSTSEEPESETTEESTAEEGSTPEEPESETTTEEEPTQEQEGEPTSESNPSDISGSTRVAATLSLMVTGAAAFLGR